MARNYEESLVQAISDKQYIEMIDGEEVIIKPIPDCDIPGACDPRVYALTKRIAILLRMVPKSITKLEPGATSIAAMRKVFNSIDSTRVVTKPVEIQNFTIKAEDGYEIPLKKFASIYTLKNAPVLYFIHGGGFFAGSSAVITEALKMIVVNTGIIAYAIDYRLAPEYPYPVGHEDCYSGLEWIYNHTKEDGGDPSNIFVAGDSAGGNMSAYCSNRNINEGTDLVKGQLLLYPTVNLGGISDPYVDFSFDKIDIYDKHRRAVEPGVSMMGSMTPTMGTLLGTEDLLTQYLTPYMDVSAKSPVSFIAAGEHDYLTVETLAYARKLRRAGVTTETYLYRGMGHAYLDQVGNYPQSEDCAIEMGKFILKHSERTEG